MSFSKGIPFVAPDRQVGEYAELEVFLGLLVSFGKERTGQLVGRFGGIEGGLSGSQVGHPPGLGIAVAINWTRDDNDLYAFFGQLF